MIAHINAGRLSEAQQAAYAQMIAHRVNVHDELLQAAERLAEQPLPGSDDWYNALVDMRRAIARAKGE